MQHSDGGVHPGAASSVRGATSAADRQPVGFGTVVPALLVVGAIGLACGAAERVLDGFSGLVLAVAAGMVWANTTGVASSHRAGTSFAAKVLLRVGIVALGLRLSLGDIVELGGPGLAMVSSTVVATFFGVQWVGRRLGLDRDLALLVATGYSICGASAIAAMEPNTDARDEHVAASIGLVTLFGTLAVAALPTLAGSAGLDGVQAGSWIGASTHDVAQVVALRRPSDRPRSRRPSWSS